MMLRLFLFFIASVMFLSCGKVDRTNENVEKTNENIVVTNSLLEDIVYQVLNSEKVLVFDPEFISPEIKDKKSPVLKISLKSFPNVPPVQIVVDDLQEYYDEISGKWHYLVPGEFIPYVVENNLGKKLNRPETVWGQIDKVKNDAIEDVQKVFLTTFLENDSYIVSLMNRSYSERKLLDCPELMRLWATLQGDIEKTKFYHLFKLGFKKRAKRELEKLERTPNFAFCKERRLSDKYESEALAQEQEDKLNSDWEKFTTSWRNYYSRWQDNKTLPFKGQWEESIFLPAISDPKVLGFKESLRDSYARQMSYLWVVKNKLLNREFDEFKNFIIESAQSGLEIDPVNPFSFEALTVEEFQFIREFFERALFPGNSTEQAQRVRLFIADAVFVMYERQLIKQKIDRTRDYF